MGLSGAETLTRQTGAVAMSASPRANGRGLQPSAEPVGCIYSDHAVHLPIWPIGGRVPTGPDGAFRGCPMPSRPAFQARRPEPLILKFRLGVFQGWMRAFRQPPHAPARPDQPPRAAGNQDRGSRRRAGQRRDLNKCTPQAVAFADLAAEVATEVRLLRAVEAELALHAKAREQAYHKVDPEGLARSLPGVAEVGGPVLQAAVGRAHRFGNGSQFKSFTGLTPKASETGETDRKGRPMSKAGSSLLRTQLLRSADTARTIDPQLAQIYYTQMVERGANHLKALCVVASHLAERGWAVLARGTPYELRDIDGSPVNREEAQAIVVECWTVPEEVRRRRRSKKKVGKAPHQVLSGHVSRARNAVPRRPSPRDIVDAASRAVKAARGGA